MIWIICILIYIISIIWFRNICRRISKKGLWLPEECTVNYMWFIPVLNTLIPILCEIGYRRSKVDTVRQIDLYKSSFLNFICNKDLLDENYY